MSDHRLDTFDGDLAGASRCSLEHAQKARKYYGRSARPPQHQDEQGAINVVELLDCGDPSCSCGGRWAFFQITGLEQCEVRRLPVVGAAAIAAEPEPSRPAPRIQTARRAWPATSSAEGLPLFGTPGCAAITCDPVVTQEITPSTPAIGALVCSECEKPPQPGVIAIEGGTHYVIRQRNDWSRPKVDFKRTHTCGKWKRVAP